MATKEETAEHKTYLEKIKCILKNVTVEPLMFLDGLAFSIMSVFIEDLQMRRICEVSLQQDPSVCSNLSNHTDISDEVQLKFSVFAFYDGIIKSALPLFFILFMGAWSDKYGRKVPLYTVEFAHFLNMLGLLLFSLAKTWPVEYMLIPTFLDSLGGGNVCFLTTTNAYISDITSESSRTSRVGVANSIFFLGGAMGTFIGKFIYEYGGYSSVFTTSLTLTTIAVCYVLFYIKESHGPNVCNQIKQNERRKQISIRESLAKVYGIEKKKQNDDSEDSKESYTVGKMIADFFSPQRIIESFKCTFKKREGNTRTLIILVILCSLLRRLTRSPYVFAFSRHVLSWEAGDYSLWVTFKNLTATLGSLVAVPLLSGRLHLSDYFLGTIGAFSGMFEYLSYGIVVFIGEFFFWIAPLFAILINSCTIAQRSILSKFVTSDELGKVSAVLGALDGIMPMANYALFMAVYRQTVTVFPAAHFFVAAACSGFMVLMFVLIMALDRSRRYDVENVKPESPNQGPIIPKAFLLRTDSRWLSTDYVAMSITSFLFENRNSDAEKSRKEHLCACSSKVSAKSSLDFQTSKQEISTIPEEVSVEAQRQGSETNTIEAVNTPTEPANTSNQESKNQEENSETQPESISNFYEVNLKQSEVQTPP